MDGQEETAAKSEDIVGGAAVLPMVIVVGNLIRFSRRLLPHLLPEKQRNNGYSQ
jgi:hypothetical protein